MIVEGIVAGMGLIVLRQQHGRAALIRRIADLGGTDETQEGGSSPVEPSSKSAQDARVAVAAAIAAFSVLLLLGAGDALSLSAALFGGGAAYLGRRAVRARAGAGRVREIEYYLPAVMERVVMAVEAGLDVLPAIGTVVELQAHTTERSDPVTGLLARAHGMAESGTSLREALDSVASNCGSFALRHAFLHLALAHSEGGELAAPLRELSDATQLYYQETVEEEIARTPVKATLPLVLTFAGLIVCFVAVPLVQVMNATRAAVPAQESPR